MTRKYIHICGPSCSGKKTLVKKLLDGAPPGLRERFGIDGPFKTYADFGDPRAKNLYEIAWAKDDIVLHWWQFVTHGWIAHLQKANPAIPHRIFLLWLPWELQVKAAAERNWTTSVNQQQLHWFSQIVSLFRQLEMWGFKVEVVNAFEGYRETTFEEIENK